jgi:hypothetical protein
MKNSTNIAILEKTALGAVPCTACGKIPSLVEIDRDFVVACGCGRKTDIRWTRGAARIEWNDANKRPW